MAVRLVLVSLMISIQISSIVAISKMKLLGRISDPPSVAPSPGWLGSGQETVHITRVSRHRANMAGGDVIIGGFAFALVTAIVCYIRVTRKNNDHQTDA